MANITLIDDDPTEALVLEGMLEHVEGPHRLTHVMRVEAFHADRIDADLVLLDRRIPPHDAFETSLPILAASGYQGPVVLMSATDFPTPDDQYGLTIAATVKKSDLLTPEAVESLLRNTLRSAW